MGWQQATLLSHLKSTIRQHLRCTPKAHVTFPHAACNARAARNWMLCMLAAPPRRQQSMATPVAAHNVSFSFLVPLQPRPNTSLLLCLAGRRGAGLLIRQPRERAQQRGQVPAHVGVRAVVHADVWHLRKGLRHPRGLSNAACVEQVRQDCTHNAALHEHALPRTCPPLLAVHVD